MTAKQKMLLNGIAMTGQLRLRLAGTMIHYAGEVHYKVLSSCIEAGWIRENTPDHMRHRCVIYELTMRGKAELGMETKITKKE